MYESDRLLSEYLLFHYGSAEEVLGDGWRWPEGMREALGFAERTVRWFSETPVARGLDLGCAVGRATFEMARACDEVIGIDFSESFVSAAQKLKSAGRLAYDRLEEGATRTEALAKVPEEIDRQRVNFLQGDAMALPDELGAFDRVHAANLLCRLAEPKRLLERLPSLVKPGGELVLMTPCTWLAEFTPPQNWPEGSTMEWLKRLLEPDFELLKQADEPFLIRETARKFQWALAMGSLWRRVGRCATSKRVAVRPSKV